VSPDKGGPLISSYHGATDSLYPLPNDEREHLRLDSLHFCFKELVGGNIVAPIGRRPALIGYKPRAKSSNNSGRRYRLWNVAN
jgi:hypothetical protein